MQVRGSVMQHECVFIILGATGDLTKRKLIPAIYKMVASGIIARFAIIGVSLDETTMQHVFDRARIFIPDLREAVWERMIQASYYQRMDFNDHAAYEQLKELITSVEQKNSLAANRLFYLATMPHHFMVITQQLAAHGVVKKCPVLCDETKHTWQRIVYEKPFGDSLASSRQINEAIAEVLDERQVFRIDHWLGKELVGNIALARFTNRVFEPLWHAEHIESVQIIASEKIGIEGRGQFYDAYGTLKDMVQNHLLQLLALVAMEDPVHFTADYLRDAKAAVLSKVAIDNVILGQYDGYLEEKGVSPTSTTDTFAAVKISIDAPRWRGVPFYLKAGKFLEKKEAAIHIKFKPVRCLLDICPTDTNYLTINIQPHEGMYLTLNAKKPGVFNDVTPINMHFSHAALFGPNTPAAYEVLLADVLRGDQCAFVRADEIDLAWRIIQQISNKQVPLQRYARGSTGPDTTSMLDSERTIIWKT
ncbi:glucose-6-phosphate dehydrogenase [Candidatus Dependentiae bacterium]|nr:glucose-6-phosphate dehydrogenase [Candidatus Dependentiae bacterium]